MAKTSKLQLMPVNPQNNE